LLNPFRGFVITKLPSGFAESLRAYGTVGEFAYAVVDNRVAVVAAAQPTPEFLGLRRRKTASNSDATRS
jgi:hypothetical protein